MSVSTDAIDTAGQRLSAWLANQPGVCVCLSGGVDSSLLAHLAARQLGSRMMAITGVSASLATDEERDIDAFCTRRHIRWVKVKTDELAHPDYIANAPDRCFHCKNELYGQIVAHLAQAADDGMVVIDGTHHDDLKGHRPGHQAAQAHGVRSPLAELGIGKDLVRALAERYGLENAARPSAPCLSSRIAYGVPVTQGRLEQIAQAEHALKGMGFGALRVRLHGEIARIEVTKSQLAFAVEQADAIVDAVKAAGFTWVTLDLAGLRSGSLLEVLPSHTTHSGDPA